MGRPFVFVVCSDDSCFENRFGNLENFLFDRGYSRGELEGQFNIVRDWIGIPFLIGTKITGVIRG